MTPGEFTCNVCGSRSLSTAIDRETPDCTTCGSNIRIRGLIRALSLELFGIVVPLSEFPVLKSVRALGIGDSPQYADLLSTKLDYVNTQYHTEPRLDVTRLSPGERGHFDIVLCSEVFEHVAPPIEAALANVCGVLKPDGRLIMTVPYVIDGRTAEHFDGVNYGLTVLNDTPVVVGRTERGELIATDDLTFHGGQGAVLEVRCFSRSDLENALYTAGFAKVVFHSEEDPEHGIFYRDLNSLPLAVWKSQTAGPSPVVREIVEQYRKTETYVQLAEHRLALEQQLEERTRWARLLESELAQRTEWTRVAEKEMQTIVADRTAWAKSLEETLQERTEWARSLENDVEKRTEWARSLEQELTKRTEWALSMERQFEERSAWAQELEKRLAQLEDELRQVRASLAYRIAHALRRLFSTP